MKIVKQLLPLWLVFLYFGSIVFMLQSRSDNINAYNTCVETARHEVELDLMADAFLAYEEALQLNPNLELALEAGEVYLTEEAYADAGKWYTNQLDANYPDDVRTYEYGIRLYLAQENYRRAFEVYEECENRELVTAEIEELINPVLYSFDLAGRYDAAGPFGNVSGIAAVQYNGLWGYIEMDGDEILGYEYLSAGMFGDMAAVVEEDGTACLVDSSGDKKITDKAILERDPELGQVTQFLGVESGLLWACNGSSWNCYDASTLQKLFGGYTAVTCFANGVGAVQKDSFKWALISSEGEELTDFVYDEVITDEKQIVCRTDAILVREGDACYLVDHAGNQIGDAAYEDACAFYDGTYAAVKQNGVWVFVDQTGDQQNLGSWENARSFSNGLAAVCRDGKWGYIDLEGNLVIDCQFDGAAQFAASGVAFVQPEDENAWRLLRLYKDNHD